MKDLATLKEEVLDLYRNVGSVYCPILQATVNFTSEGFNHLIYESNRKPRNINEQYLKLSNFCYAPRVLERCKVVTETREMSRFVKGKLKKVLRYELVHEAIPGKKIRVIVQKIGTGAYTFLSVMPLKNKKRRHRRSL